ncbi:MAG: polynucleotide kinase-phosphatase [Victivallales bacterium]
MELKIPKLSLIVLVGVSGSGKSTFARKHFKPTEVISSDACRALVSDDENDQSATSDAFDVLNYIAGKRLASGRLVVVDATNVQEDARKPLMELARQYHVLPVAIVFDLNEKVCQERNKSNPLRNFSPHVIRKQSSELHRSQRRLRYEGFRYVYTFKNQDEVDAATIKLEPLWNDKTELTGPFDIIGDVHGCYDELTELLGELGYKTSSEVAEGFMAGPVYSHPEGRTAIFLGDIVDRGPRILDTFRLVVNMVAAGHALCVPGNHDIKLLKKLNGKDVQIVHGLAETLDEIESMPKEIQDEFKGKMGDFINGLVSHYVLNGGDLVVSHAGLRQEMQGRGSGKVREFCLYGETTGETDEFGLPVRWNWAAEYRGHAMVVYGHTPVPEAEWLNRTINIDTGCVFGGSLTALRYPENELVSVDAKEIYCVPAKPFLPDDAPEKLTAQQRQDDLLDADDVIGKRHVTTRLHSTVTIRQENAAAALEVMSRYAANPKWLIYLPPTMSPSETSRKEGCLEYPDEAFAYFRSNGVPTVICEQKHMGSRAVVIICKDEAAAEKCFGITGEGIGIVYTRTGRRFFIDGEIEKAVLERIRTACEKSGFWDEFKTSWACFDCELMPWSEKAQELLKGQYAAVGAAATAALPEAILTLDAVISRTDIEKGFTMPPDSSTHEFDPGILLDKFNRRKKHIEQYIAAYRQYCWPVKSLDDLKLAPFHLLATEDSVHAGRNHVWHMEALAKICACDPGILLQTPYMTVDVTDEDSMRKGAAWWEELTGTGGEGMVVKPMEFVSRGRKGLVQPALKCRGREYLRIIYGPEYLDPENLDRLRNRGLGRKRSLALREFALGIEALERFVRKEPLRRVHECVFGVLALESEPVDPRL